MCLHPSTACLARATRARLAPSAPPPAAPGWPDTCRPRPRLPPRRDPASTWTRGTATLAGDAANPIPANLGQGGNKALEDAAVLTECLSREWGGAGRAAGAAGREGLYARLQRALALYERTRLSRAAALLSYSRQVGRAPARFPGPRKGPLSGGPSPPRPGRLCRRRARAAPGARPPAACAALLRHASGTPARRAAPVPPPTRRPA
jgi:2-polyprenyl-6-methoxyphenol hydroxylase-like FAD-dependent oxidoreductase